MRLALFSPPKDGSGFLVPKCDHMITMFSCLPTDDVFIDVAFILNKAKKKTVNVAVFLDCGRLR